MEMQIDLFLHEFRYYCNHPRILTHFDFDSVAVGCEVIDGVYIVYADLIGDNASDKNVWVNFIKARLTDLMCLYTVMNFTYLYDKWLVDYCVITSDMLDGLEPYEPHSLEIRYRSPDEDLSRR
jgi:hypothetical protein